MNQLTLPIVVGKKYVQRNGNIVHVTQSAADGWVGDDYKTWRAESGSWMPSRLGSMSDLVADYIEPAKGHPHAALMLEFARDAQESETPWDRWESRLTEHPENGWSGFNSAPIWRIEMEYRRKLPITPDPHAATAAEYAKDMAETDKAWERWEQRARGTLEWYDLHHHSLWHPTIEFRRKESL